MEKPAWRVRSSTVVVDSPYLRLRSDELELPDGTIVPDYFVRESRGYAIVFPLTEDGRVVLVRQYRYAADAIALEFPAGVIDGDEEPIECVRRELAEETGYASDEIVQIAVLRPEPVRSNAYAYVFLARNARLRYEPRLEPTEVLEVELASVADVHAMLRDGRIDSAGSIVAGYRALDELGALRVT